jgi:hypothetical protein
MRLVPLGYAALLCINALPQSFCTIIGQKRDRSTMDGDVVGGDVLTESLPVSIKGLVSDYACSKSVYIAPCPSEMSATNCLRGQLELLRLFKESNYTSLPILTKIYRRLLGSAEPIIGWSADEIIRFEESTLGSFRMSGPDLEALWHHFEKLVYWGADDDDNTAHLLEDIAPTHSVSEWRVWHANKDDLLDTSVEFSPALIKSFTDKRIQCLSSIVARGESVVNQVPLYVNREVGKQERASLFTKAFNRLDGTDLEDRYQLILREATLLRKLVAVNPAEIIEYLSEFRVSDDLDAVTLAMNKFIRAIIFVNNVDRVILNNLADCFHIYITGEFPGEPLSVMKLGSILNALTLTNVSVRDMAAIWQVRANNRFTSSLSSAEFLEFIDHHLSLVLNLLP